jgi:hypothetical protein
VSSRETRAWLAQFQGAFGELLRTPLDATSGTLRARVDRYAAPFAACVQDAAGCSARARLAVYNRQYWFRLLSAMQASWPLSARLMGLFYFNLHAQCFLLHRAPRHFDLRVVTLGFDAYLAHCIRVDAIDLGPGETPLPRRALLEAAALDAAFARVFYAPAEARFDPSEMDSGRFADRKLKSSAAYARVQEHWPLAELRRALGAARSERALPLPAPHPHAQTWALFRNDRGVAQIRLAPLQARLLELLESYPLGQALAQLEAEAEPEVRPLLPGHTRSWIAQSLACGFWIGFHA